MDIAKLCTVPSTSPSASIGLARILNEADDYSVIFENSMTNEPLFQCPQKLSETTNVPLRNGLYSTPLSWKSPQPGCRVGPVSSPPPKLQDKPNRRKRKLLESSQSDISPPPRSRQSAPDKTAHSMVEKRYRASINDKIAMLRDSVPSLRVMDKHNPCGGDFTEDLQGLPPVQKLNKPTILSKAVEYIAHLQRWNKSLRKENQALQARIDAIEILIMARSGPESTARAAAEGHQAS